MTIFNYSLNSKNYTLRNTLLWGNCVGHWNEAKKEGTLCARTVHVIIAAIEFLPIIGQIASIFETAIVRSCASSANRLLDDWMNESGNSGKNRIAKHTILQFIRNKKATKLDLSHLELKSLPDIFQLSEFTHRLTVLKLSDNELTTLPESFCKLEALSVLNLGFNRLSQLPESFGQLRTLVDLNLNKNNLTTVPESFGKLEKLSILQISANLIATLPESFGQLKSLETLYLNSNKLSTLPNSIGNLKTLNTLRIIKNHLTSLPVSIGQMSGLRELDITENPTLTNIPVEILDLPHECYISLDGDKLSFEDRAQFRVLLKDSKYQGPRISNLL